ncbi:MAG: hypothetical protein ACLP7Q_20935 [Isosphaeraceae bacterium]
MGVVKDEAIRLIQSLPEDCSIEDIQYHLYVRQKVENGMKAVESGPFVSHEDAERSVAHPPVSRRASFVKLVKLRPKRDLTTMPEPFLRGFTPGKRP